MSPRGPVATADRSAYGPKPAPSQSPTRFSRMTAPTRRPSGRNHSPFDCAASGVNVHVPLLSVQIPPFCGSETHSAPPSHRGPSPKVSPSPYRLAACRPGSAGGTVGSGHVGGEVLRGDEGRRGGGPPAVEGPFRLPDAGGPPPGPPDAVGGGGGLRGRP